MGNPSARIIIRRLDHTNVTMVGHLFDRYRQFYRCTPDPVRTEAFLHGRVANAEAIVFSATCGDSPSVAFSLLYPTFSSLALAPVLTLNDLWVEPQFRRRGIARQLLNSISELAHQSGACRIEVATASDNIAAQSLYRSFGYVSDTQYMRLALNL